jgi:hypothetical protein
MVKVSNNLVNMVIENYVDKKYNLKDLLYISVNLDDLSCGKLKELFINNNPWGDNKTRIICHHMTMAFHNFLTDKVLEWAILNDGKVESLKVVSYGWSDKAFAVAVETDVPSTNKIKHVTCAINLNNNGKPVDSNSITNWVNVDEVFDINGVVTFNNKKERGV